MKKRGVGEGEIGISEVVVKKNNPKTEIFSPSYFLEEKSRKKGNEVRPVESV